jgi:MFS transporter, DHA1 family, multidrug resistance protein
MPVQPSSFLFLTTLKRSLSRNQPFIAVWLALFITIAGIGMVSPLLPKFASDMGASGIWVGLAFSGYTITQIPLMLVVGQLSDRFGKKRFLCLGLIIYAVAAVGYMLSPSYQELLAFRVFSGVGTALVIPVAYAYVGELSPTGSEGRYMGVLNVATIAGFGLGPALGGLIYDTFGMDATFLSMCVLSTLGFFTVLMFLPADPSREQVAAREAPTTSFPAMLKDNTMRAFVVFHLMLGISYGSVLAFLPIFMTDARQTSAAQVGLVISSRSIVNGVLSYPSGALSDRMNRVILVVAGGILLFVAISLIPSVGGFAALLPLLMAIGLCEAMTVPSATAIGVGKGREFGMGSVMGLGNMANATAMLIGSMLGGVIETSAGIDWVFRSAGLFGLACVTAFFFFIRRAKSGTSTPTTHIPTHFSA